MMSARRFSVIALILVLSALLFSIPTQAANAATCAQVHYVQQGQNLFRISLLYGTTVAELQRLNGLGSSTRIYAGTSLCVKADVLADPVGKSYVVQYGDTLSRISRAFGVNMDVLARVNNIFNVNRIYAGQVLSIPDFTIQ
jgi:spore germination protein